ncbi:hypothetical protein AB0P17_14480 [Streptomyces sp. NPDC088124]|uniref:hypothetical protein n=1 Tax=Streptomyces sp. NPDC088124 TaxID=3154654 RepID=UPI0034479FE8
MMPPEALDRLRAEASRADYASMARLARALYEDGLGPREVLRECYGTAFPEELFVVVDAGPWELDLLASFTNQPWQLALPLDRGGPDATPDTLAGTEQRILARDPDLMPLMVIPGTAAGQEDLIVCYRLSELRVGRPTAFCLRRATGSGEAVRCGESMLAVLYDEHAESLRLLKEEFRQPSNRGAGSVDGSQVEEAGESLELVRELQRLAASRQGD